MSDTQRIRAFRHALDDASAERVEHYPWGTAVHSPSIGNVYDMNFLRVERGRRGARSLAREADEIQAHLFHRRVVLDHGGARLAADFKELGWAQTSHLVMAHRREID